MPTLPLALAAAASMLMLLALPQHAAAGATALHQPRAVVRYDVDLTSAHAQLVRIDATFDARGRESLDLHLPAWRPGRYVILDPAGTIRWLRAADPAGRPLPIERVRKSHWRIATGGAERVVVSYELYANSLNDRTRHADDTHAFLSGSSVFVFDEEQRGLPVEVSLQMPEGWTVATGLEADPARPGLLLAADYDVLVDSPIEAGLLHHHTFDVDGVPHEIAVWDGMREGPRAAYDFEKMASDFAAIVRSQRDIFGDLPYTRYVFLIHVGPGLGGGTEHLNSTIMQARPEAFADDAAYRRFLGLVSHEVFHTWNVKQLRPAEMVPYDYHRENHTTLLWVAEGTTSYYDDLILARTGLITPARYLDILGDLVSGERSRPGRLVQSLEDSSFDAWTKFNRATPDSPNSTVSFYSKGALVSLMLDAEIRRRTAGRADLDDLLRTLYQRFPLRVGGFTRADLLGVVAEICGSPLDEFFRDYVAGTAEIDPAPFLAVFGLEIEERTPGERDPAVWTGLSLRDEGGGAAVTAVASPSPAEAAGLNVGDEIIAIDGRRLRTGALADLLQGRSPGDTVTLRYFRRDELRETSLTLAPRPAPGVTVRRVADPTPEQRAAYEDWLGVPWPAGDDARQADADGEDPKPGGA